MWLVSIKLLVIGNNARVATGMWLPGVALEKAAGEINGKCRKRDSGELRLRNVARGSVKDG